MALHLHIMVVTFNYETLTRYDFNFAVIFGLSLTIQKIAYRSTSVLAYERPVPWGWASLDMPCILWRLLMSLVISLHTSFSSLSPIIKYRAQAQALYS